jgi:nicotinamidase-related amidase
MSWRLQTGQVALVLVDVQEKLLPAMEGSAGLERKLRILVQGLALLDVPIYVTEQYPKGLGRTVASVLGDVRPSGVFEKTAFSAGFLAREFKQKHLVVAGLETHICVRQTVYDLRRLEKEVVVVADAVGSRETEAKNIALAELQRDRVVLATVEGLLFELMETAEHPKFKAISALVK